MKNVLMTGNLALGVVAALAAASASHAARHDVDTRMREAAAQVRQSPHALSGYKRLIVAQLQKARESGDVMWFPRIEKTLAAARAAAPPDTDIWTLTAQLRLNQHRFADAIAASRRVLRDNPYSAASYGVIGDGEMELGHYGRSFAAYQKMVDLRPNMASYSRVAHVRELQGDFDGAEDLMRLAINAGNPMDETTVWVLVELGETQFRRGDIAGAERSFRDALIRRPGYVHALAGLGRIAVARKRFAEAVPYYEQSTRNASHADDLLMLASLYQQQGREKDAQAVYARIMGIGRKDRAAGIHAEAGMAAVYMAQRDWKRALPVAIAEVRHQDTVAALDRLGWTYYHNRMLSQALAAQQRAMRLGTRDAPLFFHMGMIRAALGQGAEARKDLNLALSTNPYFDHQDAVEARQTLARLEMPAGRRREARRREARRREARR